MTISPRALSLCERLSLDPRSRDCGPSNPMSARSPIKTCTKPNCDCGPSGELEEIEAWLREQDAAMLLAREVLSEIAALAAGNLSLGDQVFAVTRARVALAAILAQEPTL